MPVWQWVWPGSRTPRPLGWSHLNELAMLMDEASCGTRVSGAPVPWTVRVNCVFLNGRNFGSGRLSSIHELCGTFTKGGASGEVSGAMTTDGDPGGTLDSHTNGMSEGQILSMEVRPETRPSATSSASFSNFPEPRKTTDDSTSTLTARSPVPNLNS